MSERNDMENNTKYLFLQRLLGALITFAVGLLVIAAQKDMLMGNGYGYGGLLLLVAGVPIAVVVFLFFYSLPDREEMSSVQQNYLACFVGLPAALIVAGFLMLIMSASTFLGVACFLSVAAAAVIFIIMHRIFDDSKDH